MAVIKKPYELSIWSEALKGEGQKEESRKFIIGAHDMTYLGRASAIKLKTKINGTHELTFQVPTKYFDSEKGEYVHNHFIDEIFAERKVKLYYKDEWLEFTIKQVKEDKKLKGLLKNVTCQDAFIDELSRNGYGITFDEELYNNVEEIGIFTEEILEDSIWYYEPKNNWGDFTEYLEEKLYKIPVSNFNSLNCYKLNFTTNSSTQITNAFTGEHRDLEMGDDQARVEKIFWDQKGGENPITSTPVTNPENDGYIYIPYSCLDFCYCSTNTDADYDIAATEEPYKFEDDSLALAPFSVNPNTLIQFYAVPAGAKLEIDEAGLILDKSHIYFMTLDQWNKSVKGVKWYIFKEKKIITVDDVNTSRIIKQVIENPTTRQKSMGNKIISYDGYLTEWDSINIVKGKKIQISDRSEINISDEIDQYVTVYNNSANEYDGMYTSTDWVFNPTKDKDYRVCSKIGTRQIIPQLARNFIQNGTDIKSTNGWEVMGLYDSSSQLASGTIKNSFLYSTSKNVLGMDTAELGCLYFSAPKYDAGIIWQYYNGNSPYGTKYYQKLDNIYTLTTNTSTNKTFQYQGTVQDFRQTKDGDTNNRPKSTQEHYYIYPSDTTIHVSYNNPTSSQIINYDIAPAAYNSLNSVINFGPVGQEKSLEKDKIYCLGVSITKTNNTNGYIKIGEGSLISSSEYSLDNNKTISISLSGLCSQDSDLNKIERDEKCYTSQINMTTKYLFIKPTINIEKPYVVITAKDSFAIFRLELFEVYTKGKDQFSEAEFQYSGRDYLLKNSELTPIINSGKTIAYKSNTMTKSEIKNKILFEDDVMMGDTYEYQQYFIQKLKIKNEDKSYDTMGKKEFISSNPDDFIDEQLPLDGAKYSEDDYEIQTNYIDLNNCSYYNAPAGVECGHSKSNGVCMYQMYGYCPYRFKTEKHCRKIRTLKGEKSNRFNLTQELSKVFECYPIYKTEHTENGYIKECIRNNKKVMDKRIFFIKEKGNNNPFGFRYHKNLSDVGRTIKSDKIVTKLYVQDVDSDISRTGLCSIKTAEDNPSKDSFIIDFSYYTTKGMLDKDTVEQDLYGVKFEKEGLNGYLKTLGFYNEEYDRLTNQIINLEDSSFTELEANLNVNLDGIETAQKQMRKYAEQIDKYKLVINNPSTSNSTTILDSYKIKYAEQEQILNQLIVDTFQTYGAYDTDIATISATPPSNWISKYDIKDIREEWLGNHIYKNGILGQYNKEYLQIQAWKKERASYLKAINNISSAFFKKYEPFLKEGTWSDSNYISDNAYYHGALEVAAEGAIPSVEYTFKVLDISALPEYKDYEYEVSDTSFIEDEELFGLDVKTGLPNRIKVLISELSEDLDSPSKNSITVQNFTTQFEDLFKQVTATVQSLTFNQNIYKRSSNFTSLQNVSESSLQGTLDSNNLTLLSTSENNIQLDATGQKGSDINNHANQYALDGQGLQFSNNGGESWNVGVGPSGINADYINVGTLDAGKIRIADSGYVYFAWDKEGIAAYRDPQSATTDSNNINDYALFNKCGLSLIKNGTIRLRSGYGFNGSSDGKIETEKDVGSDIGFYLYNKNGNVIFRNYTTNDDMSARIEMQGELFLTDGSLISGSSSEKIYTYSNVLKDSVNSAKVYTKGSLDTTSGTVIDKSKEKVFVKEGSDYTYGNLYKCTFKVSSTISPSSYVTKTYLMTQNQYNNITLNSNLNSCIKYSIASSSGVIQYVNSSSSDSSKKTSTTTNFDAITIYSISSSTTLTALTVYKVGTSYYKNKTSSYDYKNSGAIGLFLNNKKALESEADEKRRILSCVTTSSNSSSKIFNNIFTIMKDGSLYIGGTINDTSANSLSNLSDTITVDNAPISMNTYGQLILDFENLRNSDDTSLIQYVTDAIKTISLAGEWGKNRLGDWDSHENSVEWETSDRVEDVRDTLNKLITCVADMRRALNDIYLLTKDGIQTQE